MSLQPKTYITSEEYLALERKAENKSEYFDGEIFAMAGASPAHVLIVTNVVSELRRQLKQRPCTVYSTDLRLQISQTGLFTYPDVMVVCGKPRFNDDQNDTLLNPILIIEVLSDSTKDYDRGEKFEHYRSLETFKEYVLVAQDKYHVEHFTKQADNRWLLVETNQVGDTILLTLVDCELALAEIYDKVEFVSNRE